MIDIFKETPVPFAELARQLSDDRSGPPKAVSTIHRWRKPGIRGVRLEAIRIGGVWNTTREAFARFCAAMTEAADPSAELPVVAGHDQAAADRALDQSGW